jgi:hypothetical protein
MENEVTVEPWARSTPLAVLTPPDAGAAVEDVDDP